MYLVDEKYGIPFLIGKISWGCYYESVAQRYTEFFKVSLAQNNRVPGRGLCDVYNWKLCVPGRRMLVVRVVLMRVCF